LTRSHKALLRFHCKRKQFNFFHPRKANITLMNTSNFVCIKVLLKIVIAIRRLDIGVGKNGWAFTCAEDRLKERRSSLCCDVTHAQQADNTWPFVIEGNLAFLFFENKQRSFIETHRMQISVYINILLKIRQFHVARTNEKNCTTFCEG